MAAWKQRAAAHEPRPLEGQERQSEPAAPGLCFGLMLMSQSPGGGQKRVSAVGYPRRIRRISGSHASALYLWHSVDWILIGYNLGSQRRGFAYSYHLYPGQMAPQPVQIGLQHNGRPQQIPIYAA